MKMTMESMIKYWASLVNEDGGQDMLNQVKQTAARTPSEKMKVTLPMINDEKDRDFYSWWMSDREITDFAVLEYDTKTSSFNVIGDNETYEDIEDLLYGYNKDNGTDFGLVTSREGAEDGETIKISQGYATED